MERNIGVTWFQLQFYLLAKTVSTTYNIFNINNENMLYNYWKYTIKSKVTKTKVTLLRS